MFIICRLFRKRGGKNEEKISSSTSTTNANARELRIKSLKDNDELNQMQPEIHKIIAIKVCGIKTRQYKMNFVVRLMHKNSNFSSLK